jgi:Tfp pilus assembly protein PilF
VLSRESPSPPRWWGWFLVALAAGALAWRAATLVRLLDTPLLTRLDADAEMYWAWASQIREGRWVPTQAFFLGPLYPYVLAVLRSVSGDSIVSVLCAQSLFGAASVVLVADATRRVARPAIGALVGVVLAGHATAVVFDLLVLAESLLWFLGCLALWLAVHERAHAAWLGAIVGLMALGRPTSLLLLAPCGADLAVKERPRRWRALAALLAVPLAVTAATAFHHWRLEGSWTPITYSGGFNLYVGNGPDAAGSYASIADAYGRPTESVPDACGGTQGDGREYLARARGLRLTPTESSRYWYRATIEHVQVHPWRAALLLLRKLAMLFNHRELPQIIDPAVWAREAGPLGWPAGWSFAFLGVAGLAGAVFAWRGGPAARLACGWLAALAAGFAVFFVVDRYRLHLLPSLALLSGLALDHSWRSWRERRWKRLAGMVVAAGAAAVVVFAPLVPAAPIRAEWSHGTTMGDAWLERGQARRALEYYERAIAIDPLVALHAADSRPAVVARASVYENAGIAHALAGNDSSALAALATAVHMVPEAWTTRSRYAAQLAIVGRMAEALDQYRQAGVAPQDAASDLVGQAAAREAQGDRQATRRLLEAAIGIAPDHEPAVVALLRMEILEGSISAAARRLAAAETSGVDRDVLRAHAAWILTLQGDTAGARRALDAIAPAARHGDPRVVATLRQARRHTGWGPQPAP